MSMKRIPHDWKWFLDHRKLRVSFIGKWGNIILFKEKKGFLKYAFMGLFNFSFFNPILNLIRSKAMLEAIILPTFY